MAALLEVLVQAPTPLFGPAAQDGGGEGVRAGEESARLRCALADAAALTVGGAGADALATAGAWGEGAAPAAPADPGLGEVIGRCGAALGLVVEAVGAGDADGARGAIASALTRLREVLHHAHPAGPGEGAEHPDPDPAAAASGSGAGAGDPGSAADSQ